MNAVHNYSWTTPTSIGLLSLWRNPQAPEVRSVAQAAWQAPACDYSDVKFHDFFALKYFMKYFWNISKISQCFLGFRLTRLTFLYRAYVKHYLSFIYAYCSSLSLSAGLLACWTTDNINQNTVTNNTNKQIGRYNVLVVLFIFISFN